MRKRTLERLLNAAVDRHLNLSLRALDDLVDRIGKADAAANQVYLDQRNLVLPKLDDTRLTVQAIAQLLLAKDK